MAIPHAHPGDLIDVRPLGPALASSQTTVLLKTDHLEAIRLVLPAGKEIPPHKARGEITVHCLEGKVEFTARDQTHELSAGKMLYLLPGEIHGLRCLEDASILVTLVLPSSPSP